MPLQHTKFHRPSKNRTRSINENSIVANTALPHTARREHKSKPSASSIPVRKNGRPMPEGMRPPVNHVNQQATDNPYQNKTPQESFPFRVFSVFCGEPQPLPGIPPNRPQLVA